MAVDLVVPQVSRRPLNILLSEGSSLSARQTLYALGRRHRVDLLDPGRLCLSRFSSLLRRYHRCPRFSQDPQGYLSVLVNLLREKRYDVLLGTHEQVFLLSRFREPLSGLVGVALPAFDALEELQCKAAFTRLLRRLDLPHPVTEIICRRTELERQWVFPCYLKLAHSTAGQGVYYVQSDQQLRQVTERLERQGLLDGHCEILVQQPARGGQASVQAVFQNGRMVGVHCFEARRLGVGGMSTARVSAHHPIVFEQVARLGAHLEWHGALFLDYFHDPQTGRPEYIEANPRIGETVNATLSGVNLAELLVRVSLGEPVEPLPLGRTGVLTQSFLMILISAALEGNGRTALLRELRRLRRREGIYGNSHDDLTRSGEDPLSVVPLSWVLLQLLAWPGFARGIVRKTVENYSLALSATETIRQLPVELQS